MSQPVTIAIPETTLAKLREALIIASENTRLLLGHYKSQTVPPKTSTLSNLETELASFASLADSIPPPYPEVRSSLPKLPWDKVPSWTITAHAADGTTPMRATRHPGSPILLEGDAALLVAVANEIAHLTVNTRN